ncbi:hypothetical protein GcM3_090026, partial [Golovinomyces cichoracearum]
HLWHLHEHRVKVKCSPLPALGCLILVGKRPNRRASYFSSSLSISMGYGRFRISSTSLKWNLQQLLRFLERNLCMTRKAKF